MEFRNRTPFPALAFQGIDTHDQRFHVVVLRQTLTWSHDAQLVYADEQQPLCFEDSYFGEIGRSGIRQESDLAHFKPRCDVLLNATAYAPGSRATPSFAVRLRLTRPDSAAPLPPRPRGLNPWMAPDEKLVAHWQKALARAQSQVIPGAVLIDKTLIVTGERSFKKDPWPFSSGTLGSPQALLKLPLRDDYAWGGECRINAGDRAARDVPAKHRLTPTQQLAHPDAQAAAEHRAVAHHAVEANPIGRGFSRDWYLNARGQSHVPAPQIESPGCRVDGTLFSKALQGKLSPEQMSAAYAGFGVRPKGHPARRKWAGTLDQGFIQSQRALPSDFDFAVWNAAAPDQQTDYLAADETLELTNLCAPSTPGAQQDPQRNSLLRLVLPGHRCRVLLRLNSGEITSQPMRIDTLLLEPDSCQLTLVWRAVIPLDESRPIRVLEAFHIANPHAVSAAQEVAAHG